MNVLGIDPGKDGGLVLLDGSAAPLHAELSRHRFAPGGEYDDDAMARCIRELRERHGIGLAVLERQSAMPRHGGARCPTCNRGANGAASSFTTGIGFGLWRMALAAYGIERIITRAADWHKVADRKLADPPEDPKERAIMIATLHAPLLDLMPGQCRVPQTALADAACMALVGLWRQRTPQRAPRFKLDHLRSGS